MKSKYHNRKAKVDGQVFASTKEARRYMELTALQKAGEIADLRTQVPYTLIPMQKVPGRKSMRATKYIADFVYTKDGKTVVEDAKGYRDGAAYRLFTLKKKLMYEKYGIYVEEV